jgi:hypothetical protein
MYASNAGVGVPSASYEVRLRRPRTPGAGPRGSPARAAHSSPHATRTPRSGSRPPSPDALDERRRLPRRPIPIHHRHHRHHTQRLWKSGSACPSTPPPSSQANASSSADTGSHACPRSTTPAPSPADPSTAAARRHLRVAGSRSVTISIGDSTVTNGCSRSSGFVPTQIYDRARASASVCAHDCSSSRSLYCHVLPQKRVRRLPRKTEPRHIKPLLHPIHRNPRPRQEHRERCNSGGIARPSCRAAGRPRNTRSAASSHPATTTTGCADG